MVNEERIRKAFAELVAYDSESFREKQIGEEVAKRLRELGLEVTTDEGTDKAFLESHPSSFPNIYAVLKGTVPGDPVLFSAHLDTVAPGTSKRAVTDGDGTIHSAGNTVLGADDVAGIISIFRKFDINTRKAGGIAFCRQNENIRAYSVDKGSPAVRRFERACRAERLESRLISTLGGSDANRLNEAGIPAIVIACGMENVHSTEEYTTISDLRKSAELTIKLMTIKEEKEND